MKPIPMHFLTITFEDGVGLQTFHLSPFFMQTDTVWDIDEQCREWYARISLALERTWHNNMESPQPSGEETVHQLQDKSKAELEEE